MSCLKVCYPFKYLRKVLSIFLAICKNALCFCSLKITMNTLLSSVDGIFHAGTSLARIFLITISSKEFQHLPRNIIWDIIRLDTCTHAAKSAFSSDLLCFYISFLLVHTYWPRHIRTSAQYSIHTLPFCNFPGSIKSAIYKYKSTHIFQKQKVSKHWDIPWAWKIEFSQVVIWLQYQSENQVGKKYR